MSWEIPRNGRASLGGRALYAAAALAAVLCGCELLSGGTGGGTETETAVLLRNTDGSLAVNAQVLVRPADYLADTQLTSEASSAYPKVRTDNRGRFWIRGLAPGAYRMEAIGGNGRGVIRDFVLDEYGQHLTLPDDTLRPFGTISGSFVLDSAQKLPRYIQIYGIERIVEADSINGSFMIPNLPPATYDLRFLGLEPFRKQAVLRGIQVQSGKITRMDPVVLEELAKLTYRVEGGVLAIDGVGPSNPVIFDNEFWDNGVENEYIWAKASQGRLDLRGNIVTYGIQGSTNTLDEQLAEARNELQVARQSGLSRIPVPVAGSRMGLAPSPTGRLDDIAPEKSAGSDLIVAAARLATPERPLLVVTGGALTTVANAYLTDPSIAPRMVVMAIYPFTLNAYDSLASYLVAKRCRMVIWGGGYLWGGSMDSSRVLALPGNRMAERVRDFLLPQARANRNLLGDIAPVAALFSPGAWTDAERAKVSLPLSITPASSLAFDFLNIPETANAWSAYQDEFFGALEDAATYAPAILPGRLEAEGYSGRSGARGALTATGSAPDTSMGDAMAGGAGAWLDFTVVSAASGPCTVSVRHRAPTGGRLSLAYPGGPILAEITLPSGETWKEATSDLELPEGAGVLRATWSQGSFELDAIEIR